MNAMLVAAATAAAIGFGGAWQVQEWRYGAKEKERVEEQIKQMQFAAAGDIRRVDNQIVARNAEARRTARLGADAGRVRDELYGLRGEAAAALRAAQDTHAACLVTATASTELLNQCGERYSGLAEKASRHVSDIQTLTESWPSGLEAANVK